MKNSELVTNKTGAVYHLNLHPDEIADTIFLVGDPNRVDMVSAYFDKIEVAKDNRELKTRTGYVGDTRMTVLSTGMGTDNIDIVVTELDELTCFDLEKKKVGDNHRTLNLIRIGTCGALNAEISLNTPVLSHYSIGLDGLLYFYDAPESIFEHELAEQFTQKVQWSTPLPGIYACKASEALEDRFVNNKDFVKGITVTAPGFYGPQGRAIRLPLKYPRMNEKIMGFNYNGYKVSNYEMETSALYGLGQGLGHNTLSICLAIANRSTGEFCSSYKEAMGQLIESVITAMK
ncbi:MAG: nucleoside phosphorylase [Bacteroidales bacterium]|nr:nucleoside phosphorylase [Bacteroidales bacterium]